MMAEMMAAIMAISLAMAALGGVTRLAAMSQRSHVAAQDRLRAEHRLEALLSQAADQATPAGGSSQKPVAVTTLRFACGLAGEGLCQLSAGAGQVVFRRDGQVVGSADVTPGALQFRTVLADGPTGAAPRLVGQIFMVRPGGGAAGLLVVSERRPDAPVDCAYDPEGFACRLPPRPKGGAKP